MLNPKNLSKFNFGDESVCHATLRCDLALRKVCVLQQAFYFSRGFRRYSSVYCSHLNALAQVMFLTSASGALTGCVFRRLLATFVSGTHFGTCFSTELYSLACGCEEADIIATSMIP